MKSRGNTLAGQRKAKLEAKKLREEREEEIRKKEDIDEAIFKAAERKKAIAHAKTLTSVSYTHLTLPTNREV